MLRQLLPLGLILALVMGATHWLQSSHRQVQAQVLRELARPGDIRMISSTTCVFCEKARRWLVAESVPFEECFIETDAACMAEYRARGARGTPTMVVRGQTQLGFDKEGLSQALRP
ncbi:glutaredoxin [Paucibacter oligotrophus]|uniref:Glutaredoxin n=1 Tax=Roseateles oligotrophus TaxID=1769250 RepID=A0A840LGX0_9BURK|nr:glutaredoxin family protein [Roseateles oligotrophus]MBB4845468.1 glutaredoxin [Roseateles oligotrophus]